MSSLAQELTKLRRMLLSMSAEVEQRVEQAFDALLRRDARKAEMVKEGDDTIDQFDVSIEAECVEILALHQPVAVDLRFVLAALRVNADLERIGDLARGIAKRAIKLERRRPIAYPPPLVEMTRHVRGILANALKALADQDEELAHKVRRSDGPINDCYHAVFKWAAGEMGQRQEEAKAVIDVLSAVRGVERIADLATNIAESVIFAVGGTIVRHAHGGEETRSDRE